MTNVNPNTRGLAEHRTKKKNDSFDRVCLAIEYKVKNSQLITIKSIAEEAKVSRTYIYENPALKEKIASLRKTAQVRHSTSLMDARIKARTRGLQDQLNTVSEKYKNLQGAHTKLQNENKSLKCYIEELTEQLNQFRQQIRIIK